MKIAAFGCLHGMLNEMYQNVAGYEEWNKTTIELVIVCGDCQTVRHEHDLKCVNIKPKFYRLGDFHEYYSGKKKIPKLTIFVGGNHEASNYLSTLPYGGWVCENFYYMGHANVIRYKGLRIGGISGIYNYHSSDLGRYEKLPFDDNSLRSVYHTRNVDIYRLHQLAPYENESSDRIDIFLSHDWPQGISNYGNYRQLMNFKRHLSDELNQNKLGNPLTKSLVGHLKPKHWFAAHLHCKYTARVEFDRNKPNLVTEFLSLDKIEPRKRFMEVMDIDTSREFNDDDRNIYYDSEWLSVLKKTNHLTSTTKIPHIKCPHYSNSQHRPSESDIAHVQILMKNTRDPAEVKNGTSDDGESPTSYLRIPNNFAMNEPVIYDRDDNSDPSIDQSRSMNYQNSQTVQLCSKLGIKDPISDFVGGAIYKDLTDELDNDHDDKSSSSDDSTDDRQEKKLKTFQEDGCLPFFIDSRGER